MRCVLIAAFATLATAAGADTKHIWPGYSLVPDSDSWAELHAPTKSGAVASLTFDNKPVHSRDEEFSLVFDGLEISVKLTWNDGGSHDESLTIEVPDGYVVVPRILHVAEHTAGVAHIYKFRGM